jgi:hypothetical protein
VLSLENFSFQNTAAARTMECYGLSMSFDGKQACDWTERPKLPTATRGVFRWCWWGFLARISPSTPNPTIMIVNLAAASKRDALGV